MASEPDGAGSGQFEGNIQSKGLFGRPRTSNVSAQFNFNVPGLGDVQKQLSGVSDALKELKSTLQGMASSFTSGPIVNMLADIRKEAAATSASLHDLSGAVHGVSGGGGRGGSGRGTPSSNGNSTSPHAAQATQMGQSASAAVALVPGSSGGQAGIATTNAMGSQLGKAMNGLTGDLGSLPVFGGLISAAAQFAMMPLNFTRERIQNNRAQSLGMAQELTPYQWATGGSTDQMMANLSSGGSFPGKQNGAPGMQGTVSDILTSLSVGRQVGAQYGFGDQRVQGKRAQGFYEGIAQMQQITPGLGAGQAANILGKQVSDTSSQQASAFYTGGAFSMIKQGGGQKNIREWSEGILRFLETQRPGKQRGKKFNYQELLAQNFPGSNINAWFETVGVSAEMRDYFWSYAMGQAQTQSENIFKTMGGEGGTLTTNQAWRRLGSTNVLSRNEFGLAGKMEPSYARRESSNQSFNQMMGALINKLVPALVKGPLAGIAMLPDQVEEFLWNALQTAGPVAQGVIGGVAASAAFLSPGDTSSPAFHAGPGVGDPGGYGAQGGSTSAGLTPDLRKKVNAMMAANPKLQVNSGLRDSYTQSKLAKKGIGNFAGGGMSPHAGGWAADIGPSSQYGWLQKNAGKFGLQTASAHGEPWHVQNSGTMTPYRRPTGRLGIGDPGGPGTDTTDPDGTTWHTDPDGTLWRNGIKMHTVGGIVGTIGSVVNSVTDFGDDIRGLVQLLKTVFGSVLEGINAAKNIAGSFPLDIVSGGEAGMGKTIDAFTGLLTGRKADGGLPSNAPTPGGPTPGGGGGTPNGGILDAVGIGPLSFFKGPGGAGGGSGSLSDIYSRYAGGNPSSSKSADSGTQQRILKALDVASQAGFSGEELVTFVSLAGRESHFNPTAYNGNRGTGDDSYGEWQINTLGGMWEKMSKAMGLTDKNQLFDPLTNAKAGKYLFDQSKTPFFAWGPYRGDPPLHGGAEQWVAPVYAVAQQAGYLGDPGDVYGGGVGNKSFSFNNTFNIDASGGGFVSGGLDIERLVPKMADKLESEMRRRLVSAR